MIPTVRVDGVVHVGRVIDLRDAGSAVDASRLCALFRGAHESDSRVSVRGVARPGPVADQIGVVRPGMSVRLRPLLAAVARSLGRRAPEDDARERVEADLAALDSPETGFAEARSRVAAAGRERDRLRERVATLRGRVQALRDRGADTTSALAAHRSAARDLAAAETERAAAVQLLDRERERARTGWDVRERRLALRDRADNLARAARARLATSVRPSVERALDHLPGASVAGLGDAPGDATALAALRVATVRSPVILARDRFDSPTAAADWLGAPVVRVEV